MCRLQTWYLFNAGCWELLSVTPSSDKHGPIFCASLRVGAHCCLTASFLLCLSLWQNSQHREWVLSTSLLMWRYWAIILRNSTAASRPLWHQCPAVGSPSECPINHVQFVPRPKALWSCRKHDAIWHCCTAESHTRENARNSPPFKLNIQAAALEQQACQFSGCNGS